MKLSFHILLCSLLSALCSLAQEPTLANSDDIAGLQTQIDGKLDPADLATGTITPFDGNLDLSGGVGGTVDNAAVNAAIVENESATSAALGTPHINVRHYGATGNGVTDDTTAIQNAIAAAKTAKLAVYLPKGTYKVSGTLTLDWPGAHIFGDGAQDGNASEITTASTTLPVISIPGDYNHTQIRRLKIDGPGRATSSGYGINLRGDLVGGSNIDFLQIADVEVNGFDVGIYFRGVANSTVIRTATEDCNTGIHSLGNNNSNTFQNCAFVCTDGTLSGTIGLRLSAGSGSSVISSDFGAPTLEKCLVIDGAVNTAVIGCSMEAYWIGIETSSVSSVRLIGTRIGGFGSAAEGRYSLICDNAYVYGCTLGITNLSTGAAIKQKTRLSRGLFVHNNTSVLADIYTSGGVYDSTVNVAAIAPLRTQSAGETASASNSGAVYRDQRVGSNEALFMSVKSSSETYAWANLLEYYWLRQARGSDPAFLGSSNTFTASPQTIQNATSPYLNIHTGTNTAPNAVRFGIATGAGSFATGTVANDTVINARSGGNLCFAGNTTGNNQTVRIKIKPDGTLNFVTAPAEYADNAAALAGGLVSGDVYKTSTGQLMIVY